MIPMLKQCDTFSLGCFVVSCPLSVLASTAFAMSLQPIIDVGLSGDTAALVSTTVIAILAAGADILLFYFRSISQKKVVISYCKNLRSHYFNAFFQQDITQFMEKDSALYLSKLTADTEVIGEQYCESLLNLYQVLWSLIISSICIAATRWELAIGIILISLVSVNLPKLFQNRTNAAEQDYLASSRAHLHVAQESLRNYLVIRLFRLLPSQTERYRQTLLRLEKTDIHRQKISYGVDATSMAISNLSFISIIALCMVFVLQGKLTVGYTMSVSQLLGGIMVPFEMFSGYLVTYRTGKNIFYTYEAELSKNKTTTGTEPFHLTHQKDMIVFEKVSFTYHQQPYLLHDISLSLDLHKKYAFVGKSGSGKSTLAKMVIGLLQPTCGTITWNGIPLHSIDKNSLYGAIAYQSQQISFLDGTIRDNILLGKQLPEDIWHQLLRETCLEEVLQRLPDHEFTQLSENGKNISGGEAQRICLARCLASQPAFVILDEIAAALDTQNAVAIEKAILSLEKVGVLYITHRILEETMRQYDTIFVLKDGRISEQGTWDTLMAKQGDFYQLALHQRSSP